MAQPDKRLNVAQTSRPCKGCGALIHRTVSVAPIRHYCSPDCRPRCSVEECEEAAHAGGFCGVHYYRSRHYGDPLAPRQRQPNVGECAVDGCGQPSRKRGWCASHYALWQKTGEVRPFKYKWAERGACKVCGKPCAQRGRREFCSNACQVLWGNHGGLVPATMPCVICGSDIVLTIRGKGGKRKRADVRLCDRCRQDSRKHGVSVVFLALRDGTDCSLCCEPIDMALRHPEKMRASVDHILPRAHGGTNDPENLQLTHLWCNQVKSDRLTQ